jgi:hypothetical protein
MKGRFNETTRWTEIEEFVVDTLENPIEIVVDPDTKELAYVYNFNFHKVDFKSLKWLVRNFPDNKNFIIPHSMSAAWGFMLQHIPEEIANNSIYLNYRANKYLAVFTPTMSKNIFKDTND